MRKIKLFIGILLMILSISSLLFWEMEGRDVILLEPVLVAKEDIAENTKLDASLFVVKGIPRENLLEGALRERDLKVLTGRQSRGDILKNSQLTWRAVWEKDFFLKEEESVFVIQPQWIAMRSSALRKDDWVDIYRADGSEKIGTYKVAFVKDSADREVKDLSVTGEIGREENWLYRTDSTSVINHIEIISTLADYIKILHTVAGEEAGTLIILQKGEYSAS